MGECVLGACSCVRACVQRCDADLAMQLVVDEAEIGLYDERRVDRAEHARQEHDGDDRARVGRQYLHHRHPCLLEAAHDPSAMPQERAVNVEWVIRAAQRVAGDAWHGLCRGVHASGRCSWYVASQGDI